MTDRVLAQPVSIPGLGLDLLLDLGGSHVWSPMLLDPSFGRSRVALLLPPASAGAELFLQSFHITNVATFAASNGLHVTVL